MDRIAFAGKSMVVNFVPDGKTKGMSVLKHSVDAETTTKGMAGEGGKVTKMKAEVGADGKMSKKALAKLAKKDAKTSKKAGGAAPADDKKKGAKTKGEAPKQAAAVCSSMGTFFSGPAADLWDSLLSETQWLNGAKLSQADA